MFSKIYLRSRYHQVGINVNDISKQYLELDMAIVHFYNAFCLD